MADELTANDQGMSQSSARNNTAGLLMHMEVPISVSLGRAQIRMKELLGLTHGSVVELEEQVSDEVEIRINKCLIAHGQVVAVDGNYGVRITRMAGDQAVPSAPPEAAPVEEK